MTATLTYTLGAFVWREHFTRDLAGAKKFYGELFGWTTEDRPMGPDWSYTIIKTGGKEIGGMMDIANLPDEAAAHTPPHWAVYVSVPDVDAAAAKAEALGGKSLSPCMDIPNVGRFAMVQDPQGAVLNVFKSATGDPPSEMPKGWEFCWEALTTTDGAKAADFYQQVVGWGVERPGGEGIIFSRKDGAEDKWIASVAVVPTGVPPHWGTFVAVETLEATNAKCQALGGEVVMAKVDVPGFGAFSVLKDPAGAFINAFEPDMSAM